MAKDAEKQVYVNQVRSAIHCTHVQRATLSSLGLRGIGQRRAHKDTSSFRGRVKKIAHLVRVEGE